jgi:hypothetical protein
MVGNNHRGNTHSTPDSRNSLPGIQTQFRPKPERQNAAPERKPIHLPPMLLREPFSSSLFYLPIIRREVRQKASRSPSGRDRRTSKRQRTDTVGYGSSNNRPRLIRQECTKLSESFPNEMPARKIQVLCWCPRFYPPQRWMNFLYTAFVYSTP